MFNVPSLKYKHSVLLCLNTSHFRKYLRREDLVLSGHDSQRSYTGSYFVQWLSPSQSPFNPGSVSSVLATEGPLFKALLLRPSRLISFLVTVFSSLSLMTWGSSHATLPRAAGPADVRGWPHVGTPGPANGGGQAVTRGQLQHHIPHFSLPKAGRPNEQHQRLKARFLTLHFRDTKICKLNGSNILKKKIISFLIWKKFIL